MNCFATPLRGFMVLCCAIVGLNACGGGGGGSGSPVPAPVPSATQVGVVPGTQPTVVPLPSGPPPVNPAAYTCPASAAPAATVAGGRAAGDAVRRMTARRSSPMVQAAAAQLLAVTYDARTALAQRAVLAARESALGATLTREYAFGRTGVITRILNVPAAQVDRVEIALRSQAGVRAVGRTGSRRYATGVTQPYFTNDPYFTGFSTTVAPAGGAAPPAATFKAGPLEESANVPGQWDMHVTRLESAFAYSQPNNGSGLAPNPAALGSAAVKIAVIDTGADATHPELAAKIVYQRCFITNPANVQSSSTFSTDEDGHGTDVAGIAGAATNNGLGFTGAGGNVDLYAYRVFPTPNDNCAQPTSNDAQCGTDTQDIATAIKDAVANNVDVISLSLGGSPCVNGADSDQLEGAAVAEAIAANIIVVAASGNGSGPPVESPACNPGVIAVGATALADGAANGSGRAGGSPGAPFEYVPTYSDYGTPGAAPGSSSAWGIVAPGGDPTDGNDADDLHWIENVWTSTPFMTSTADRSFAGSCTGDYPNASVTPDCRIFIAGTSMSTPHVAGAAALILSVNPAYKSPARMKELLCSSAADIGDPNEGCGRLDVYRAMATALGDPNVPAASPLP